MTAKPKPKPKKKTAKKSHVTLLLSILFILIAVVTVTLLEYIDFKNGKKSFIFTRIFSLEKKIPAAEQFNASFIQILTKNNIGYDYFRDEKDKYHFELEIDEPRFTGLISRIQNLAGQLNVTFQLSEIQGMAEKSLMLYRVEMDQRVTHLILITKIKAVKPATAAKKTESEAPAPKPETIKKTETPPVETPPSQKPESSAASVSNPRLAIIIDDIGAYDIGALELKKLNIPITASVLPDSPNAHEEARWLKEYGIPALIHLPMQPRNGDGQTYDVKSTITRDSGEEEIRAMIRKARDVIPFARGLNNHQGSLATSDAALMARTLKVIGEEGLFFVDSKTIGDTVAYDTARQMGVKTVCRDVFLDHVKEYNHTMQEIRRLTEIALQKGKGVAIGHPNPSTIQAIRDSAPYIRKRGVSIVYVSELLE